MEDLSNVVINQGFETIPSDKDNVSEGWKYDNGFSPNNIFAEHLGYCSIPAHSSLCLAAAGVSNAVELRNQEYWEICNHADGNPLPGEPSGNGNIYTDPVFIDPESGGFGCNTPVGYMLQADSPCINSGRIIEDNGGRDYSGNTVPAGTASSIGACQYQALGV